MQPLVYTPVKGDVSQEQLDAQQAAYNSGVTGAQQAQQGVDDYQKSMLSGTDLYKQGLETGNQQSGYDPLALQSALKNVQQTQNVIAGLPQSINAQNSNYGATASDLAGQYSGMMNNLNPALAAQSNALAKEQATQANATNIAQGYTTAAQTGQQQKLSALQNVYSNAANIRDNAMAQLQKLQDLFQQNQQFNASESAEYAKANAQILSANAAMKQAEGAYNLAMAQVAQTNQQVAMQQAAANAAAAASKNSFAASPAGKAGMPDLSNYTSSTPYNIWSGLGAVDESIVNGMNSVGKWLGL